MNQTGQINQDLLLLQIRATAFGISYSDLMHANRAAIDWRSWSKAIAQFAERYESLAEKAMTGGHQKSAAQWWQSAANYYHFAQMFMQGSQKADYQIKSRDAYGQFAKLATSAVPKSIKIPYEGTALPGYIRVNQSGAPVVILIGGLEFAKEVELHQLGQPFVDRGMSVLYFDGPGQGELADATATAADFEPMMKAVLDFLYTEAYVTAESGVGIFGICSGGYFGMRAAAMDRRLAACISLGGFLRGASFFSLAPRNKKMVGQMFGIDDIDAMTNPDDYFPPLSNLSQTINCPLFIVQGSEDHLVPLEQTKLLEEWAEGETQTWVLEGAEHMCLSRAGELLPVLGDWMAAQFQIKSG